MAESYELRQALEAILVNYGIPAYGLKFRGGEADRGDLSSDLADVARRLVRWEHEGCGALVSRDGQKGKTEVTYQMVPTGYLRRLEELAELVGGNEDGILECWSPVERITDLSGRVDEHPCGECPPCRLRLDVEAIETWMAEHDYTSPLTSGVRP